MTRNQRWLVLGTVTFLAAAVLILGGCAAEGPVKLAGLEQKIEAARTRADHQEITAVYEQQADGDRVAAERHRGLARAYERGYIAGGSRARGSSTARRKQEFRRVCENSHASISKRQRRILRWRGASPGGYRTKD